MRRYHPDKTLPENGEVFVFGSNEAGIHGLGAALVAKNNFGARVGVGVGYMTRGGTKHCYAIPTKNKAIKSLSVSVIHRYIEQFVLFSRSHSYATYYVTRVGCGLAGHKDSMIAPLFADCGDNVIFPEEWKSYLEVTDKTKQPKMAVI